MSIPTVPIGNNPPEDINVIVEIPYGGPPVKYELDKETGRLHVDRYLKTPMHYPGSYGFVPDTLSLDGDPVDVLICDKTPLVPGAVINCRPIGVLIMEDEAGMDEKIIAVPSFSVASEFGHLLNVFDLPEITRSQTEYFFEHYKDLEKGKWVEIIRWVGAEKAREIIQESIGLAQMTSRPKLGFPKALQTT